MHSHRIAKLVCRQARGLAMVGQLTTAQGIEAGTATTGTGVVHESPVGQQADAPNLGDRHDWIEAVARAIEADLCRDAERVVGAIWASDRGRDQMFIAARAAITALQTPDTQGEVSQPKDQGDA